MNKFLIIIGIVALGVVGWFIFSGNSTSYVAEIDSDVSALEIELAELEASLANGDITPEEAAEKQTKIVTRLDAINVAIAANQNTKLSSTQQAQLMDSLERLKQTLITYRATLTTVDEKVRKYGGGSNNRKSAVATIEETIASVEEHAEDVIDDYEPEDMATSTTEDMSDTATSTDEMSDDTGTTTDETMDDSSDTDTMGTTSSTTDSMNGTSTESATTTQN